MKLLQIDNNYYAFPKEMKNIEEFIEFINNTELKFLKLTMYDENHCVAPYFIEEEKTEVYVNISMMRTIEAIEAEVMPRIDYECRLLRVVREKCHDCVNFLGNPDNLEGHYERLSLDGHCWAYEKKEED